MNPKTTLQTIADSLSLSRATVSLALRNHPDVARKTKEAVFKKAQELGYRPNPLVSALMANRRVHQEVGEEQTIAFATSFSKPHQWNKQTLTIDRYYNGAKERAQQLGFKLEEFSFKEPGMTDRRFSDILINRGIHALILAPLEEPTGRLNLKWEHFVSVTFGYSIQNKLLDRVSNNYYESTLLAIQELVQKGYQRIAYIGIADSESKTNYCHLAAYSAEKMRNSYLTFLPPLVWKKLDKKVFLKWFHQNQPDAILHTHLPLQDWLAETPFSVPDDVGVVSLNLFPTWKASGVDQMGERVGAAAVDLLVGKLYKNERGLSDNPKLILTRGKWREGDSTK